jgi:hypothetical protein
LPEREFRASGEIKYARESKTFMGEYDEVYIAFDKDMTVKRGERFTIYRSDGEVFHPHTGDLVGYKIRHLGVAKVLDASHDYVKALILKSYEEIKRGDKITTIFPHHFNVAPRSNDSEVIGTVVDWHAEITFGGQFNFAYLDKGRIHGLQRGNRLVIERRGDGGWYGDPDVDDEELDKFPWERLGEIMVVEVFEETAVGIVTMTIKELKRGERLVLYKGY